jgi:hypothetical protein
MLVHCHSRVQGMRPGACYGAQAELNSLCIPGLCSWVICGAAERCSDRTSMASGPRVLLWQVGFHRTV